MNIIAYSYYKVYRTVGASNKNFKVPRQANNQENHRLASNVEEAKVTRTLTAVVAAFAFCWLPIGVIDSIDVIQGETTLPRQVYLMYGFLVYLSSTVNPFIYGVFSRTFRREYRKLVCGKRNQVFTANAESMIHQGNSGNHTLTTTMQYAWNWGVESFSCGALENTTAIKTHNAPIVFTYWCHEWK